ncbi:sulfatase [Tessaracoccus sp. MC1756]|uniref:sulfatase family protein n=1 Tax=Tessaracoccus sp. MC1756 TaxID=2760311 RepID=UPI001600A276|nr:sulfatase [Tessaracoccus sp. MC1756]MBB1509711.1 sulfatase [Tessaracoccus sp. MC1756]
MSRPNIIFIMADDHAAHAISAYGSVVNRTPHIDRLAEEGARLDAVYCTNSICTPSRATILTGAYSHVNGACSIYSEFDYRVPTFAQVLQDRGYQTALFGKWHLGETEKANPRGFDEWLIFPGQGDYHDPQMYGPDGAARLEGYATDIITELSLDYLARIDRDRPFCLLMHHKAPHRPWVPHERHSDLYPVGTIPEPETMWDTHEDRADVVKNVRMALDDLTERDVKEPVPAELQGDGHWLERSRWKYQRYMSDYLQTVQAIDDSVGSVLQWLDDEGLADDTFVVYTSDQGFFLGDHGWFDKRLMFDESLTMPMLVRWPAEIAPRTRVEAMITNVDFAATFLDVCGESPDALPAQQGRSFRPLLRGEEVEGWRGSMYYRYWEHDDPEHHAPAHYGVRTATHKFIHYYNDGLGTPGSSGVVMPSEYELYDLVADPAELHNVADDPAYAAIRSELESELARLQEEFADQPYVGPQTPRLQWST